MEVLSLFDGISTARVALEKANIPVKSYRACEIDVPAIKISKKNFPDIIHEGSVTDLKEFFHIDLLIGGSPCTDLSVAKHKREGLKGKHSSLFWEYVRIKELLNPKYFILENVNSMSKADRETITEALKVTPIMIDASLVSAQSRKRLFWTNIPTTLPEDRHILLKDILEPEVDEIFYIKKANLILKNTARQIGHIGKSNSQGNRVYSTDNKSVTLSANGGGGGAKTGLYAVSCRESRRRLEDGVRKDHDKTIPIERIIEFRSDEKSSTLTSMTNQNLVMTPPIIRKLTPIECERLQSLPDNYTQGISNTQRYKCLGNAFNADIIAHILKSIKTDS
jgi:DNA (cytosine-5)-methyltransferase 3A